MVSPPSRPNTKAKRPSRPNTADAWREIAQTLDACRGWCGRWSRPPAPLPDARSTTMPRSPVPRSSRGRRRRPRQPPAGRSSGPWSCERSAIIGHALLELPRPASPPRSALISKSQGGMGVPARPWRIDLDQRPRRPCRRGRPAGAAGRGRPSASCRGRSRSPAAGDAAAPPDALAAAPPALDARSVAIGQDGQRMSPRQPWPRCWSRSVGAGPTVPSSQAMASTTRPMTNRTGASRASARTRSGSRQAWPGRRCCAAVVPLAIAATGVVARQPVPRSAGPRSRRCWRAPCRPPASSSGRQGSPSRDRAARRRGNDRSRSGRRSRARGG